MIQVRSVFKQFRGVPAVRDVSFDAHNGAITGVLGANGAGKTTMLRMIAGVLQPDRGSIRVGAIDPGTARRGAQQSTGALLDHTGLYPRLTARENLAYFGRLRRMPPAVVDARVDQVLHDLGLEAVADRPASAFSLGESTKVALARVLLHRPAHLLLDEPTNSLDIPTVRTVRRLLTTLRDAGVCIILSSHVLGDIEALCDRVVVMAAGTVAGQGTIDEICRGTGSSSVEAAFLALAGE